MEPIVEEIILAMGFLVLVQFWLWLFLFKQTGKRLQALEQQLKLVSGAGKP